MSSKASDVAEVLTKRPLSSQQIKERERAAGPRDNLVVSNGRLIDPSTSQVIEQYPRQVAD